MKDKYDCSVDHFNIYAKYNQKDDTCGNMLWQTQGGKNPSPANLPRPVVPNVA
jgi:hypothetical protein